AWQSLDHAVERGSDLRRGTGLQERAGELERRGGVRMAAVEVPHDELLESGRVGRQVCGAGIDSKVDLLALWEGLRGDSPVAAWAHGCAGHFAPRAVRRRPDLDGLDADAGGIRSACRTAVPLTLDGLDIEKVARAGDRCGWLAGSRLRCLAEDCGGRGVRTRRGTGDERQSHDCA